VRRHLAGSVVVVTGASSGVGAATAVAFAGHGAHVVLAARTLDALEEVAGRCQAAGGTALVVTADVGVPDDVQRLADRAVEAHGRIDTWVNDAGQLVAGALVDEPVDEVVRVLTTNLIGPTLGARVALQRFRQQGQGVLVDVASLLGIVPNPLVPTYVASKFAVRGLSLSLHALVRDWPGVQVCVVVPGPIDTPLFGRAANHTGRRLRAIAPAISPERVAAVIVSCARRPRRQATVGATGHALLAAHRLAPRLTEWGVARAAAALLVADVPAPDRAGALFDEQAGAQVSGEERHSHLRRRFGDAWGRWPASGRRRRVQPAGTA
jgi:short-subunit dehydrogenase